MSFPLGDCIHTTPGVAIFMAEESKLAPPSLKAMADHSLSQSAASPAFHTLFSLPGRPQTRRLLGAVLPFLP
jgi:hypothetical protein